MATALSLAAIRQYAAEFIGTAILVFFAAGAVMSASRLGLPAPLIGGIASGTVLMVLIWALFPISGAHVNPALTVALALFGEFPAGRVAGYVAAQLLGSAAGATLLFLAHGVEAGMGANVPSAALGVTQGTAFIIETFLSFVMMLVILAAFRAPEPLRAFAAVPIGGIVGIEVMLMGAIAGAAMNPARAFGPYIYMGQWSTFWIYVAGPLAGIVIAIAVWRLLAPAVSGRA